MAVKSVVLCAAVLLFHWTRTVHQTGVDAQEDSIEPYLLFASRCFIHQVYTNGTDRELVHEANGDIFAVDYHHGLDHLFWSNTKEHSIRRAHLNGSDITTIATNVSYPADLAVDWINNKLYWTDRDYKQIEVYDLMTSERRVVVTTGPSSVPLGLAVYPYPGYGWLYWTDRGRQTVERVAVTGEARQTVYSNPNSCPWPITLDYSTHTIYWIDLCRFRIESIRMDGSRDTRSLLVSDVRFSYGITLFEDTIYWTQITIVFSVDRVQGGPITEIYSVSRNVALLGGVEVVHPTKQPVAEEFVMLINSGEFTCDPACENGSCIDPGLCACHQGWTGLDCSLDINECELSNGGCDHLCTNLAGSYECFCNEGYTLQSNNRTCEDIDECESHNGGCHQVCLNNGGSYNCSCLESFTLHIDNRSCLDVNECEFSNGGCDHNCTNLDGSFECSCDSGFSLHSNGRSCLNASLINDMTTSPVHESTTVLQHDVTSSSELSHTLTATATPLVSPPFSVETSSSMPLPTPTFHSSITQDTHLPLPPSYYSTSSLSQQDNSITLTLAPTTFAVKPTSNLVQQTTTESISSSSVHPQSSHTSATVLRPSEPQASVMSITLLHVTPAGTPQSTLSTTLSLSDTIRHSTIPASSSIHSTTTSHLPTLSDSIAIVSASIPAHTPTPREVSTTTDGQTTAGATPTSPPTGEAKPQSEVEIIIIAAIVPLGSVLLIGIAVGYAILAYCKYRYRTAKWTLPTESPHSLAESGSPVQFSKTKKQ